jgi:NADH dehydrogenase
MENLVRFGGLPIHISIPVIPIPGAGRSLFQPIHIDDLAASIVNSLDFSDAPHTPKIIELGGSEQVSFEDLIKEFARRLGVKKPIFHAPLPLLFAIAPLFELLENPPITADQLRNLSHDNICDLSQMRSLLKIEPLSFYESMDKIFDSAATS